jgi:hypothetical protein
MSCGKWLFQYPNDILIETGSGLGGGICFALKYGFKEIHSIEINQGNYDACVRIFKSKPNVHLYFGDSLEVLPKILSKIQSKVTFLLDAHVMSLDQVHGKVVCPILEELKMIVNHSKSLGIKHSLLIDDAKLFNGSVECFDRIKISDIEKTVLDIDSSYVLKTGKKSISFT